MTQHVVVLLIMDMESAKSDANGPKKKIQFWRILIKKKHDKNRKKLVQKGIDPNYIELNLSFNEFKNVFCQIKSNLISLNT